MKDLLENIVKVGVFDQISGRKKPKKGEKTVATLPKIAYSWVSNLFKTEKSFGFQIALKVSFSAILCFYI